MGNRQSEKRRLQRRWSNLTILWNRLTEASKAVEFDTIKAGYEKADIKPPSGFLLAYVAFFSGRTDIVPTPVNHHLKPITQDNAS